MFESKDIIAVRNRRHLNQDQNCSSGDLRKCGRRGPQPQWVQHKLPESTRMLAELLRLIGSGRRQRIGRSAVLLAAVLGSRRSLPFMIPPIALQALFEHVGADCLAAPV